MLEISATLTDEMKKLIENLMRQMGIKDPIEAIRRINSGEWEVRQLTPRWTSLDDGTISFSVTSDGTTGPEWIKRLGKKGFGPSWGACHMLCSSDFKPTNGVKCEIKVLRGKLWYDKDRKTHIIRQYAEICGLKTPNAEIACLVRENFSDDDLSDMGLNWIVTMHRSIENDKGVWCLLMSSRVYREGRWLIDVKAETSRNNWLPEGGFAFIVSQTNKEKEEDGES